MSEAPTINMAEFDPKDLALEDIDIAQRSLWIEDKKMAFFLSGFGTKRRFISAKIPSSVRTGPSHGTKTSWKSTATGKIFF